jgi:hypothetical protein
MICSGAFTAQAQFIDIKTIAGNGTEGYNGDGGAATNANLSGPISITLDAYGNVYFADYLNFCVRKITPAGEITLYAGVPTVGGYSGNGGLAASANMWPHGIAMDANNNLYVSENDVNVIRKVSSAGIISSFAGMSEMGYTGDGAYADTCRMDAPFGMTVDKNGNLYFADAGNNVIRMIDTAGIITTVVGSGLAGYGGDGGDALSALLDSPFSVAVDKQGDIYIADTKNNRIRMVSAATNIITTVAGTGVAGYNDDTILAVTAMLNYPAGICLDSANNLYICDAHNNLVRMVDTGGTIWRIAGNRTAGYGGDFGPANDASLYNPFGVVADNNGNLYIADANNQRIRKTYSALGIKNLNNGVAVSTYPNPFTNRIYVSGLNIGDKVCLYNMLGQTVSETTEITSNAHSVVTVSDALTAGVYYLQAWDNAGNKKAVIKVNKQ